MYTYVTPDMDQEIVRLYVHEKLSLEKISELLDISRASVWVHIPMQNRRHKKTVTEKIKQEIYKLYNIDNKKVKEIAAIYDISVTSVRAFAAAYTKYNSKGELINI